MLLMFKVKNYTSFKNEAILDMRATAYVQHPTHVMQVNDKLGLLKTTALYGANASGKSNLISAMFFFEQYIFSQFINKNENQDFESNKIGVKMKLEPFSLSNETNDASEFDIIFLHNNKQIQYGFECTSKEVLTEWLYINDKKVFERTGIELSFGSKYQKMLGAYKKLPAERLYIAVLEYFLDEEGKKVILDDFISFFNKEYNVFTEILFESTVKGLAGMVGLSKKLVSNKGYRNKVEQYLRLVDVGIKRLDVQTETIFDERTGKKKKENGYEYSNNTLVINVRSQMSSLAKNSDTLFERTFAEAQNLHMRYSHMVLGEVYLIPIHEYDDEAVKKNQVAFKKHQTDVEKYISFFNSINGRNLDDPAYMYERCTLLVVDFSKPQPRLFRSSDELKRAGVISSSFEIEYATLGFDNFARDILNIYDSRYDINNLMEK